jgi:hypothetical protein
VLDLHVGEADLAREPGPVQVAQVEDEVGVLDGQHAPVGVVMDDLGDLIPLREVGQVALADDLADRCPVLGVPGHFVAQRDVPALGLGQPLEQQEVGHATAGTELRPARELPQRVAEPPLLAFHDAALDGGVRDAHLGVLVLPLGDPALEAQLLAEHLREVEAALRGVDHLRRGLDRDVERCLAQRDDLRDPLSGLDLKLDDVDPVGQV